MDCTHRVTSYQMFDTSSWSNALSNFIATAGGIIVGLPVAMWPARTRQKRMEKEREDEKKKRSIKILVLLESELNDNCEYMDRFHRDVASNFYPVCVESWKAFSDGGELQWLDDPELTHQLSMAYAR